MLYLRNFPVTAMHRQYQVNKFNAMLIAKQKHYMNVAATAVASRDLDTRLEVVNDQLLLGVEPEPVVERVESNEFTRLEALNDRLLQDIIRKEKQEGIPRIVSIGTALLAKLKIERIAHQVPRKRLRRAELKAHRAAKRALVVSPLPITLLKSPLEWADSEAEILQLRAETDIVRKRFEKAIQNAATLQAPIMTTAAAETRETTVVGTASGYWQSFSRHWVTGMVMQISATMVVHAVAGAAATALGVPPGAVTPLANVASTLVGSLAVTLVSHSVTIVTDPRTGLKQVAHDFVGNCSGAIAGEALSSTVLGTFGGRVAGQIIGDKFNAIVLGRVEEKTTQSTAIDNVQSVVSGSQQKLLQEQNARRDALLRQHQRTVPLPEQALKTRLFTWRKMSAPIMAAAAVIVIGASIVFVPNLAVVGAATGGTVASFTADYATQLLTNKAVIVETFGAVYRHPYLGPILKQSILRRLPVEHLENAVEYATRKILRYAPVQKIDDTTRNLLKNHVRESIIRELMIEDLLVRIVRVSSRQATLYAVERTVQAVQTNWQSIEQAVSDLHAGVQAAARSVRQQLATLANKTTATPTFVGTAVDDTLLDQETGKIVGAAMLAGAKAMAASAAERAENAEESVQRNLRNLEAAAAAESAAAAAEQAKLQRNARVARKMAARVEKDLARAPSDAAVQTAILATETDMHEKAQAVMRAAAEAAIRRRKVAEKIANRAEQSLARQREMNKASQEEFKAELLRDRDVIMQEVWDENFSDSTFNFLKDLQVPSIARVAAETYGAGALARGAQLTGAVAQAVQYAPAMLETAQSGVEMLRTATSTARVLGAKDIAKESPEGTQARFIRQLDESLTMLPPLNPIAKEELVEQLKQTAGIHSTTIQGYDIDKATSWSARDAVIKLMGLEPGKAYWQQATEVTADIGVGAPLRSAVQNALSTLWFGGRQIM